MPDAPQCVIVGGGMITQVQLLPTIYHLQRIGLVGEISVCALDAPPLRALQESAAFATWFTRYGRAEPAGGADVGAIADAELQEVQDELAARGSVSLTEALAVGALIEDLDIVDLEERLADVTHADVAQVYENLLNGSKNHLRAFVRTLGQYGESYAPEYLAEATFDAIVASGSVGGPRSDRGTSAALSGRRGRGR